MTRKNDTYYEETLVPMYGQIYRIILAAVGNENDAQDLTQEVFEKALNNLWQLRDRTKAFFWLRSIARNQVRKFFRKRKREKTTVYSLEEKFDSQGGYAEDIRDISSILEHQELSRNLESALWSIEERYRHIIAQHVMLEIPLKDIARFMNAKEGTVRVWMYRGMKQLRANLKKLEEGGDGDV